eukprot:3749414-Rhodomonas_salina.2
MRLVVFDFGESYLGGQSEVFAIRQVGKRLVQTYSRSLPLIFTYHSQRSGTNVLRVTTTDISVPHSA